MKTQQSGFTLIELVMVIVILGILAATALPKFVNLKSDAEDAALNGAIGALKSASAIAYASNMASGGTTPTMTAILNQVNIDDFTVTGSCSSVQVKTSSGATKSVDLSDFCK